MSDKDEKIINKAKSIIAHLTSRSNARLDKLYNYYNGERDKTQFEYLEENYGIGNPSSIKFIPLIRKHINYLIGDLLEVPVIAKVSCKDEDTISKIALQKNNIINNTIKNILFTNLKENILAMSAGNKMKQDTESDLENKISSIKENFMSDYEVATQNVLNYIIQTNLKDDIREEVMRDLLVAGYSVFTERATPSKDNFKIKVHSPKDFYFEKNPNSNLIKDCSKVVLKRKMTIEDVLSEYGDELSVDQMQKLINDYENKAFKDSSNATLIRLNNEQIGVKSIGELYSDVSIMPPDATDSVIFNDNTISVKECEWIEMVIEDKKPISYLKRVVNIGKNIWIIYDSKDITKRDSDNPRGTRISYNGLFFMNRHNKPLSLVADCMDLQDKYDIVNFFKDNIIANSGSKGDWIDSALVPEWMGTEPAERLIKWQAYKKSGLGMIDSTNVNTGYALNTTFGGYDDSLKADTIQAFQMELEAIESVVSSITGIFRERLNGITQHDAVSNVEVGVKNSFTVTRIYYNQIDLLVKMMLEDSLELARKVWKKGIKGSLVLGDKYKEVFTALPEHYVNSDYDVHILSSSQIMSELENIRSLVMELIGAQAIELDVALEAMTSKSMTDLKRKVKESIAKVKEENSQTQQLMQKIQEMEQSLQQAEKQYSTLEQQSQQLQQENEKIKSEWELNKNKIEMYKAQTDRSYKEGKLKEDSRRTDIEMTQLTDGNLQNDKIKYSR